MSDDRKRLIHIKSNVVENGKPKLPIASQIEFGELAINYAVSAETISLKNASGTVITFSSDNIIDAIIDNKIDSAVTTINKNSFITAAALNNLNERVETLSSSTPDFSAYATNVDLNTVCALTLENSTLIDSALTILTEEQKIVSIKPEDGFKSNRYYYLGELTGSNTFTLNTTNIDTTKLNHYYITYKIGSTLPTVSWPNTIKWSSGVEPPIEADTYYEISIIYVETNLLIGTYVKVDIS